VEQGLLSIDDPVDKIIPEFTSPSIALEASAAPGFTISPARSKITLRQLLTHTSGMGYEFFDQWPQLSAWREHSGVAQTEGTVLDFYNAPLVFEPGTHWAYSPGIDWAGTMLERVNPEQLTLGEYMQKHLFGRLPSPSAGQDTFFRPDTDPEASARNIHARFLPCVKRVPHPTDPSATIFIPEPTIFHSNVTEDSGGAGLYSTVQDYTAVLADLISPSPVLLQPATIDTYLFAPCIPASTPHTATIIRDLLSARTSMTPDVNSDDVGAYGVNHSLGGMLWTKRTDVLPAGTLTWGGLPNLKWMANRELGLCAFYASQVKPPGDPDGQAMASRFFQEIFANFA
jgi:CubicO group peptidase (beta-lactamase class C family)